MSMKETIHMLYTCIVENIHLLKTYLLLNVSNFMIPKLTVSNIF